MIGLLQRVISSSVVVADQEIAKIGRGLMVLVAVEPGDSEQTAAVLLRKISKYRVFPDASDKMNLSLIDAQAELLLVPQFTLAANTRSGLRPSFSNAASPEEGARLFATLVSLADALDCKVASGQFGANMQVALVNDGPVTFWLQET